jgi:hypothetical protein
MGIKLKRSAVAGKTPAVGDLELGELAINTHDGKLYLKKCDGAETIVDITAFDDARHGARAGGTLHAAATTSVAGFMSPSDKVKLDGVAEGADATGETIQSATAKTTPIDADTMGLIDSAASNVLRKLTFANLKATLKSYFDTLYVALSGSALTGGFTATAADDGTKSSGTYTPSPATGNYKRIVNGGAFTLAEPSEAGDYDLAILMTNNGSAGALTFSGFDKVAGDDLTTTNGHAFFLNIRKLNGKTRIFVEALQ